MTEFLLEEVVSLKDLKILDIDIETRKVGFHEGGRFKPDGCEPVVVAASWEGSKKVETFSLTSTWKESDVRNILDNFIKLWEEADLVTGHYVNKFDLPIINGTLLEFGYPPLSEKLVQDTKTDLITTAGHSLSQENLGALKNLDTSKFHMNDHMWRQVCRLTPEGLKLANERVVKDVIQHKSLRKSLAKWLNPPTYWS